MRGSVRESRRQPLRAAKHIEDLDRLVVIAPQGREEIERVLATDATGTVHTTYHSWEAPDRQPDTPKKQSST